MNAVPPDAAPGNPPSDLGRPVVAFDFDGTLTIRDSYTAFLRWRTGALGYLLGGAALLPAFAAYAATRDRDFLKQAATREFLRGVPGDRLRAEAERFAAERFQALIRPDALTCWEGWAGQGASRVIVTASPEPVVAPFAERLGADVLIGTRLAFDREGRVAGAFAGANCRGPEKVARLTAVFGPQVRVVAAYGDTSGDREMLGLSEQPHLRVFTGRPARP